MSRIVILGGAGFIGSVLVERLAASENQILVLDRLIHTDVNQRVQRLEGINNVQIRDFDVIQTDELARILSEFQPDEIYHLAANSDIRPSAESGSRDFRDTLGTTLSLAEALKSYQVNKLVFASTSAVFGSLKSSITTNHHISYPMTPISEYGVAKLGSEYILQTCWSNKLIQDLSIVRFPNVVGRNATHGIIYDFVQSYLRNDAILNVLGNGTQQKPFLLVDELVLALLKIAANQFSQPYFVNLAPRDTCTVKEIVDIFIKEAAWNVKVEYGLSPEGWKGDVPNYSYENNEWTKDFISSKDAIRSAVVSVLSQYQNREK